MLYNKKQCKVLQYNMEWQTIRYEDILGLIWYNMI